MAVSYPKGVVERLRDRGKQFASADTPARPTSASLGATGTPAAAGGTPPAFVERKTTQAGDESPVAEPGTDANDWARRIEPRRSVQPGGADAGRPSGLGASTGTPAGIPYKRAPARTDAPSAREEAPPLPITGRPRTPTILAPDTEQATTIGPLGGTRNPTLAVVDSDAPTTIGPKPTAADATGLPPGRSGGAFFGTPRAPSRGFDPDAPTTIGPRPTSPEHRSTAPEREAENPTLVAQSAPGGPEPEANLRTIVRPAGAPRPTDVESTARMDAHAAELRHQAASSARGAVPSPDLSGMSPRRPNGAPSAPPSSPRATPQDPLLESAFAASVRIASDDDVSAPGDGPEPPGRARPPRAAAPVPPSGGAGGGRGGEREAAPPAAWSDRTRAAETSKDAASGEPDRAKVSGPRVEVAPDAQAHRTVPVRETPARPKPQPAWIDPNPPGSAPPPRRRSWLRVIFTTLLLLLVVGAAVAVGGYRYYGDSLPDVETLRKYRPATVTTVFSRDGKVLGEIYEQRRYVLPLDQIPQHVQQAFVAAEDANFWTHSGIDFTSIARAVYVNLKAGGVSQGGSTITQQIAKNFLLTNDRKLERKIKEAILSWRIEEVYTKDHILYLYLNEIFLGSQAYGVEAAARTFFGKHISDVTLAEAAILAGLPPRPSDYNPHSHVDMALNRQGYVLDRMVASGFITADQAAAARAEKVNIVPRNNVFLEETPHFTEYARRYLVEKYGEELVLNQGLQVYTTCDSKLQEHMQQVVTRGVKHMDDRIGFRRAAIEHLGSEAERTAKAAAHEAAMKKAWVTERDPTGTLAEPPQSILEVNDVYDAVVTQVSRGYARFKVGSHDAVTPIVWNDWVYHPDPEQSFKWRQQDDFTRKYDFDGDGKVDGAILQVGDVVQVRVRALSTKSKDVSAAFRGTPGEKSELLAVEIFQTPELEGAMLSFELKSGAVRAMVGGADFGRSQLNRVVQGYRQVGSTFKPLVYAAGINARKLTAATRIPDAELAIKDELTDEVWKPQNYDGRFMGWMTLRKALAQSRNVVTVRVMSGENVEGMSTTIVDKFARSLGIGGKPTHLLPPEHQISPESDHLCPWLAETPDNARRCTVRWPPLEPNMTLKDHVTELKASPGKWKCRSCDLSMALGSASLTMEELARAYAVFGNGGLWIEPYYIEEVRDRDGKVLEKHDLGTPYQVIPPELSTIMTWMLQAVVEAGTATAAQALGVPTAGKTGTTNDEKDVWFVGYTPEIITSVWVGYDQPRSLGKSATGGAVALPMWLEYMKMAVPKPETEGQTKVEDAKKASKSSKGEKSAQEFLAEMKGFPMWGEPEWVPVDEGSGRQTSGWGRKYPFLEGTLPPMVVARKQGEPVIEDLATEL